MTFTETGFNGLYVVNLDLRADSRGGFVRTYCEKEFAQIGFKEHWVQHNHSFTAKKGTIRGMHYQLPPFKEIKLIRCIAGRVFDVVIDLRKNSQTFLKHFSIELAKDDLKTLFIPAGFAHGFQTLTDDCELLYCHSQFYNPLFEKGALYSDKTLKIQWPHSVTEISERDSKHPGLTLNFEGL